MRIVFFGTPEYVLPIVEKIYKEFRSRVSRLSPIVAVVTQKPKPVGRKHFFEYSAIDSWSHKKQIPVFYSPQDLLKSGVEADLGILAAYGEIIPPEIIDHFPHGILNIHPSLLPKYRGPSPIQAALLSPNPKTGVTIIKIDEKMDHGPIVSQFKEDIKEKDTLETLRNRLFERAANVLVALLNPYLQRKIVLREQKHREASYTTLINKGHGFISAEILSTVLKGGTHKNLWKIPFIKNRTVRPDPIFIEKFIRALYPWPGAWTIVKLGSGWNFKERRLKLLKAHLESGRLILDKVQLEGKKPVSWKEFISGYPNVTLGKD